MLFLPPAISEVAARAEKDLKPLYDLASNTPELLGEWQKNMYYWLDKIRTVVQSAPRDSLTKRELLQLQTQPTLRLWKGALPGAPGVYGDLVSTLTPPSASSSPAPGSPSEPSPFRSKVHVYEMRPPLKEAYRYRYLQIFEEEEVAATSPAFVPSPLAYKPATLLKSEVQQQRFFSTSSFGSTTSLAGASWMERKRPFGAVMTSSLASSWRPSGVTMTDVLKKLMKTR
jgi:hypothetical protein